MWFLQEAAGGCESVVLHLCEQVQLSCEKEQGSHSVSHNKRFKLTANIFKASKQQHQNCKKNSSIFYAYIICDDTQQEVVQKS